jgi:hypothetical protein
MTGYLADREFTAMPIPGVLEDSALVVSGMDPNEPLVDPAWINEAMNYLDSLASMRENWDGYNAAAPDRAILASAASFLRSYVRGFRPPAPSISPTRAGGVLFEWENGPHEIEVQLVSQTAASWVYLNTETGEERSGALFTDSTDPKFVTLMQQHFGS